MNRNRISGYENRVQGVASVRMSTMHASMLHQTTQTQMQTQTQHASGQHDLCAGESSMVADEMIKVWQMMLVQLLPVIGVRGFEILFDRALSTTSKSFPWLAIADDHSDNSAQLAFLKTCFSNQDRDIATYANQTLLTVFAELLESLIGRYLTDRLLSPVRLESVPLTRQESMNT